MARSWIFTGSPESQTATAGPGYGVIGAERRAALDRHYASAGKGTGA